mgnify:CR=1 FL=1|jgi:hypothetical protein
MMMRMRRVAHPVRSSTRSPASYLVADGKIAYEVANA